MPCLVLWLVSAQDYLSHALLKENRMKKTYLKLDDLRSGNDTPERREQIDKIANMNFMDRGATPSRDGEFTLQQEIWRLKERVNVLEIMLETQAKMDHKRMCALEKAAGIESPE